VAVKTGIGHKQNPYFADLQRVIEFGVNITMAKENFNAA
jgi:hypothetical protein